MTVSETGQLRECRKHKGLSTAQYIFFKVLPPPSSRLFVCLCVSTLTSEPFDLYVAHMTSQIDVVGAVVR